MSESLKQSFYRLFKAVPIQYVIVVPFVIQILVVAGLIAFISFRNGQNSVDSLTRSLQNEIVERVHQHVARYVEFPQIINSVNADAINDELLNVSDSEQLERYFFSQIQKYDSTSYIYFGNEVGGYVGASRHEDGELFIDYTDLYSAGDLCAYLVNELGQRSSKMEDNCSEDYNASIRPWYTRAVAQEGPIWSEVYAFVSRPVLGITAAEAVYDPEGNLLGVLGADITLRALSDFLRGLKGDGSANTGLSIEDGQIFIVEGADNEDSFGPVRLIASSAAQPPIIKDADEAEEKRLDANQSDDPLIRATAEYLEDVYAKDFRKMINDPHPPGRVDIGGQEVFLQIKPFQDDFGIVWLIVVVIPVDVFMEVIDTNTTISLALSAISVVVAIGIGAYTAQWIVGPILQLNSAAKAISNGEWEQKVEFDRQDEIGELAQSFNHMADQLSDTFTTLQSSINQHRSLFEGSKTAIIISRPDGEIVEANPAGANLFGYPLEEINTHNMKEVYVDPNERLKLWLELEKQGYVQNFEVQLKQQNGTKFTASITATAQQDKNGRVVFQKLITEVAEHTHAKNNRRKSGKA